MTQCIPIDSEGGLINTFRHGVHPAGNKAYTADKETRVMPPPAVVSIPVAQHIGKPSVPVVSPGDRVVKGQKIAAASGLGADVFASVSGTVTAVEDRPTLAGICRHILIENDYKDETTHFSPLSDPSRREILSRVAECGIVGMGGAGFPTAVKLDADKPVDTLIVNGAECEPYITCDYRLMVERSDEVIDGALLMATAAGVRHATIAVEDNKRDAAALLAARIEAGKLNAEVVTVKTKYPQGAEKQLVYAVTKRRVPAGKLPTAVGCIVSNVHTAYAVHQAVREGKPSYERYMTVSGDGIAEPANLLVATGTSYKDVIDFCGGEKGRAVKMISGGPMMGIAASGPDFSVTKTSGCLLLLTADAAFTGAPGPCINCAGCSKACPMSLMPMYIDACILHGDLDGAEKYGAKHCIECGCCAYVCPAKRPLVQSIRLAKKKLREAGR